MITLLHLLSYVGGLAAFLFITLSLASGLLWIAELIEEHSRYAKVVGMRAIYVIMVLHVLLILTDGLPILPTLFSIACHFIYLQNFSSSWPFISLTSPTFILSCVLVVADHFTWFFHFASKAQEAKRFRQPKYRYGSHATTNATTPGFMDVAAFFAICVWFIPLFLFLSLSANDHALPSSISSNPPSPSMHGGVIDLNTPRGSLSPRPRSSASLVKSVLAPLLALLPRLRRRSAKRDDEGLLAPRTPIRGSPLHTPVNMSQQSYFPWGSDDAIPSVPLGPSYSSGGGGGSGSSLTPDSARTSGRQSAPPPRRVQSDAQINKSPNPRGLAVRNGKPVFTDAQLTGEPESLGDGSHAADSVGSTSQLGLNGVPQPRMSLGPQGDARIGQAEIVAAEKRKAD
ncbi:Protein SVP26 [Saitozyma sp. JCM 24511]|nr:Protein SVP26 [Saitozyma sp. JCM 24511]